MISIPPPDEAKALARRLRRALAGRGSDVGHSASLELVAAMFGAADWNTYLGVVTGPGLTDSSNPPPGIVCVLRMFDWDVARPFYVDYLGWQVEAVVQEGDHLPVYARVRGPGGVAIELSEHHGDGTPGSVVVVVVDDVGRLARDLAARSDERAAPGIGEEDGRRSLSVHDPFGNRITFRESATSLDRTSDRIAPIVTETWIDLDPVSAFSRFTSLQWWRDYGRNGDAPVVIERGEVIFRNPDGDLSIGAVTVWEPGRRYAQTFTLAQDPDHPTTLTVTFAAERHGTTVRVEHGGWDATNAQRRAHFTDWPIILGHYVDGVSR